LCQQAESQAKESEVIAEDNVRLRRENIELMVKLHDAKQDHINTINRFLRSK